MKTLTRKSLDELAKILPVVNEDEQQECWGGGVESCVFNCFDYLDGARFTTEHYYQCTLTFLGYTPDSRGGVQHPIWGKLVDLADLQSMR